MYHIFGAMMVQSLSYTIVVLQLDSCLVQFAQGTYLMLGNRTMNTIHVNLRRTERTLLWSRFFRGRFGDGWANVD